MKSTPGKRALKLGLVFLLLLLTVAAAWLFMYRQGRPMDPNDQVMIEVRIPQYSTAHNVAAILIEKGLIRDERVFLAYCYWQGHEKDLQAGLYDFSKSQALDQIIQQLVEGKVKQMSFTIPEGYTVRQISELLVKSGICSQEQWQAALQVNYDYPFLRSGINDPEKRLEGYLYPDTYTFEDQTEAEAIINMMLTRFNRVWDENFKSQAQARQLQVGRVITVASLIEREAQVADERKRIAGVIYNRLQKGMPLQIDASVIYALGEHRETVTYHDLEIDSPYNTYKRAGLPPGPIASPGRAAIEAAVNPELHNYYYYVAKGDGSHQFSATYLEHLEAVRKYGK